MALPMGGIHIFNLAQQITFYVCFVFPEALRTLTIIYKVF